MEKSALEKALEQVPTYKQMEDGIGDKIDFPDAYRALRTVEKAYEQLQKAGNDVTEQLTERRYQVAEMVARVIDLDSQNIAKYLEGRVSEGKPGEAGGDVENWYHTMAGNIRKLGECLSKLYAGDFKKLDYKQAESIFPEPDYE